MVPSENKSKPVDPKTPDLFANDERWKLVQEILTSRTFAKASRLSHLLEYICRCTLEGHASEINEQHIGIHVFGRSPSYNPADDSIVRTQARLLRQRLEEYFEQERPNSPRVIKIPRGGYVPVFQSRDQAKLEQPIYVDTELPHAGPRTLVRRFWWLAAIVVVGFCVAIAAVVRLHIQAPTALFRPQHAVWAAIFSSQRPAIVVVSDDALVLLQEQTHKQVSLDDYLSGEYIEKEAPFLKGSPISAEWMNSHQYTSTADLQIVSRIVRLPEAQTYYVETRSARDVRMDDLKAKNAVLVGGIGANPWVGVFSNQLNFAVEYDWKNARGFVQNKNPRAGESEFYNERGADGIFHNYGVLAFLPGFDGRGNVLLFEGTGMAGTEAAAEFLFNEDSFGAFVRRIAASPGQIPHFEVLIDTPSIGGASAQDRVIAYRTY